MFQLKTTPFHERTSKLCLPQNWRRWAGYIVVGSYDLSLDREYWAIRDTAALIDVSPLMKYLIDGPDAALLLHRVTTRDVLKMAVGSVSYTGWCDEEGKMLDDGTGTRSRQGPKSRTILNLCCKKPLDKLKYFRAMQNTLAGVPVSISRTGYTG